jgi:glycosyltransferase involved in cell wall biosynthesis
MKKVLLLAPSMSSAGGAEKLIDSLSRLLENNYDISIASLDAPGTVPFFKNRFPFYPLGKTGILTNPSRVLAYINWTRKLAELKRSLRIDLTISILWRADLINALSQSRDRIISLAVIDIINNPTNINLVRLRRIVGFIYRRFNRILAIAPQILNELVELYSINPEKIGLFKNFLSCPETPAFYYDNKKRFVFCGRAVYEKNIDGLLHVFSKFLTQTSNYQLVIIGDGPLLGELMALAQELKMTVGTNANSNAQVLFIGATEKPEKFMRGARAFMLTSRHEGVPTVVILAAALGLPILAADCHGGGMRVLFNILPDTPLSDLDEEEELSSGLLLPIPDPTRPNTLETWVRAMNLVELNQDRRHKLAAGALELAAGRSPQAVRTEWILTIESVLSS